jgi:hypothetical protein
MSKHDDDRKRFVRVPLPQNPTEADLEAFVEEMRRLARESGWKPSPEEAEDDESRDDTLTREST